MSRILSCPHCGPPLTTARLRCDRCGRDLEYIDIPAPAAPAAKPPASAVDPDAGARESEQGVPDDARAAKPAPWKHVTAAVLLLTLLGLLLRISWSAPPFEPEETHWLARLAKRPAAPPSAAARRPAEASDTRASAGGTSGPGDLAQTLERYRAALEKSPEDVDLLDNVGQILVVMGKPAEAVPYLERAVAAEPSSVTTRFDLASAYARSGRPRDAMDQYRALVSAGAADTRVHHNLGLALRQLGRHEDASAEFRRAIETDPAGAPSWLGLALSLEAEGHNAEAVSAFDRYLALEPAASDADNVRARIARLRSAGEASQAKSEAEPASSRQRP